MVNQANHFIILTLNPQKTSSMRVLTWNCRNKNKYKTWLQNTVFIKLRHRSPEKSGNVFLKKILRCEVYSWLPYRIQNKIRWTPRRNSKGQAPKKSSSFMATAPYYVVQPTVVLGQSVLRNVSSILETAPSPPLRRSTCQQRRLAKCVQIVKSPLSWVQLRG